MHVYMQILVCTADAYLPSLVIAWSLVRVIRESTPKLSRQGVCRSVAWASSLAARCGDVRTWDRVWSRILVGVSIDRSWSRQRLDAGIEPDRGRLPAYQNRAQPGHGACR